MFLVRITTLLGKVGNSPESCCLLDDKVSTHIVGPTEVYMT